MRTPIFIFNSLDLVRGGLTKAVITRANVLSKHFNEVIFLTLKFQPNFNSIVEQLYSTGKLNKNVKVINLFDDVMGNKSKRLKIFGSKAKHKIQERGLDVFTDKRDVTPSYRYYNNGLYIKYKRFDKHNILKFIDYFSEGRHRYRREEFNDSGHLVRTRHMDLNTNKPKLDRYFDPQGKCYLTIWINKEGQNSTTLLFGKENQQFDNHSDFVSKWLADKVSLYRNPVVISDARSTDNVTATINAKKIAVLHNNHYKKPYDGSNGSKHTWEPFFKNVHLFDRVVFLTNEQKEDITTDIGIKSNYVVIPHAAVDKSNHKDATDYSPYLAISIARYNVQKRLDEAIRAFRYVVDKLPNAEYHIYGFGEEKSALEKLIKELHLEKNVKLKGFTDDPTKVYQKACCSILTSDFEGFGMVLTESLASGTPVISFNIKYGPRDIIRDGVDGFLIDNKDKQKMADKIIHVMENQTLRQQLASNTQDVLTRFSHEQYVDHWVSLIKEI
ncbi:putative poly(glycerol-phosphate) alpha-glucosyltransferase [Paraliobacillus sp. PM-2]|uniref:glycosyltransferase n=1 Tax=Paraliobacillus sp. PM-2 TaxID=1462524 RepID=UPI00061C5695|nr:glycosyltransferase [Paraliobacillus sp. PM-2]CQR46200.1 putative poly(glycerol-phosphate) alpha-glucosyltransferase [Paraliobacillus sp. PM-2]